MLVHSSLRAIFVLSLRNFPSQSNRDPAHHIPEESQQNTSLAMCQREVLHFTLYDAILNASGQSNELLGQLQTVANYI